MTNHMYIIYTCIFAITLAHPSHTLLKHDETTIQLIIISPKSSTPRGNHGSVQGLPHIWDHRMGCVFLRIGQRDKDCRKTVWQCNVTMEKHHVQSPNHHLFLQTNFPSKLLNAQRVRKPQGGAPPVLFVGLVIPSSINCSNISNATHRIHLGNHH